MTVLAFAAARDVLGFSEHVVECAAIDSALDVVTQLKPGWIPPTGWRVALDQNYADWNTPVGSAKELAVLPPVSGG
jgi:molybdopterin synthase sulfur carrier subunit